MATPDVVLIHGLAGTRRTWDGVIEHLDPGLRAHAVALRGHRHGEPLQGEPVIEEYVDGLTAELDALGLRRAHLVGNSLGGWLALELAARGRALSVLALAPAGFWDPHDEAGHERHTRIFTRDAADARRARPLLPFLMRFGPVRRHALRHYARHADRITRAQALEAVAGTLECAAQPRGLELTRAGARRYERFDCPVRVRLCEHDVLFPPQRYEAAIRRRVLGVDLTTLPGVGHVPMIDDPALVAREIEASVRAGTTFVPPSPL